MSKLSLNQRVLGSIPTASTNLFKCLLVEPVFILRTGQAHFCRLRSWIALSGSPEAGEHAASSLSGRRPAQSDIDTIDRPGEPGARVLSAWGRLLDEDGRRLGRQ